MIWEQKDYYIRTHEGREDENVKSLQNFYDGMEFMMTWSLIFVNIGYLWKTMLR